MELPVVVVSVPHVTGAAAAAVSVLHRDGAGAGDEGKDVPPASSVSPEPPTLLSHRYFSAVSPPNFAHFTPFFARSLRLGARKPETAKER